MKIGGIIINKIIILSWICIFILSGVAQAEYDEWNNLNKNLGKIYLGITAIDWCQTRNWIEGSKDDPVVLGNMWFWEANPIYPNNFMGFAIVDSMILYGWYSFIDEKFSSKQKTLFLLANIVIRGSIIINNAEEIKNSGARINIIGIKF